jgi:hypothetical protein
MGISREFYVSEINFLTIIVVIPRPLCGEILGAPLAARRLPLIAEIGSTDQIVSYKVLYR